MTAAVFFALAGARERVEHVPAPVGSLLHIRGPDGDPVLVGAGGCRVTLGLGLWLDGGLTFMGRSIVAIRERPDLGVRASAALQASSSSSRMSGKALVW